MNIQRLFRVALFTSPVLAVYGLTPVYILSQQREKNIFWIGLVFLTLLCFLIWTQNILLLMRTAQRADWQRYALSFFITWLMIAFFMTLRKYVIPLTIEDGSFFPILNATAINLVVLIIIDSLLSRERKNEAERAVQELTVQNMEAQQQLMMQQYQPHFLFNALSTLKSLMGENLDEAEDYLLKLSDFLRTSVQAHQHPVVRLEEELNFTRQYLEMQQIRFEGAFSCRFELPPEVLSHQIPVFALQSLVENALKHNGFSPENPLQITVRYEAGTLLVSNNKIPKQSREERSGTGLASLSRRHELITKEPVQITETDTEFSVALKLLPHESTDH